MRGRRWRWCSRAAALLMLLLARCSPFDESREAARAPDVAAADATPPPPVVEPEPIEPLTPLPDAGCAPSLRVVEGFDDEAFADRGWSATTLPGGSLTVTAASEPATSGSVLSASVDGRERARAFLPRRLCGRTGAISCKVKVHVASAGTGNVAILALGSSAMTIRLKTDSRSSSSAP